MLSMILQTRSYPSATIAVPGGRAPIEVHLISQLGLGTGSALVAGASLRQRGHANFVDALDEPSARIGAMHLDQGSASTLFSFVVGPEGHPFHCHAGERVFTAISGSSGAQLRFSTATPEQMAADPAAFLRQLHVVQIPGDSLFTVRFGGGVWHQFIAQRPASGQPALFALSCHPNELGGALSDAERAAVQRGEATIPSLTQTLPPAVEALLNPARFAAERARTVLLSLDPTAATWLASLGSRIRSRIGALRAAAVRGRGRLGYEGGNAGARRVREIAAAELPEDLLLHSLLTGARHYDGFLLELHRDEHDYASASQLLGDLLDGFVNNPPLGVTWSMRLRNWLVRPLRLRTSTLGCPVSSLIGPPCAARFAGFPVHASAVRAGDRSAEVILGADDRHLRFRTAVRVDLDGEGGARCYLANRVQTSNAFGRLYMALIDHGHRHYVAPTILRFAVDAALQRADAKPVTSRPLALAMAEPG